MNVFLQSTLRISNGIFMQDRVCPRENRNGARCAVLFGRKKCCMENEVRDQVERSGA